MTKMSLLPELAEFLNAHGILYTARRYLKLSSGEEIDVEGVGTCIRFYVAQIARKENLAPWLSCSGFQDTTTWWKKIKSMNRGYVGCYYLYMITKKGDNTYAKIPQTA
jgi:hypothetical protein